MIVSLSMRTAMSRTPQQDFALFSALLLVCLRPFPTELSPFLSLTIPTILNVDVINMKKKTLINSQVAVLCF